MIGRVSPIAEQYANAIFFIDKGFLGLRCTAIAETYPVIGDYQLLITAVIAQCWADPARASKLLGWKATRGLDTMCADAWRWQLSGKA